MQVGRDMKQSLLVASLVVVLTAGGRAHAESKSYVALGVELGGGATGLLSALDVDGGIAVGHDARVHARFSRGHVDDLSEAIGSNTDQGFFRGSATFVEARAGLETVQCTTTRAACFVLGADLGVLRTGDTAGPRTDTPSMHYTEELVIPRAGIEFGTSTLRAHLTFDLRVGAAQRSAPMVETSSEGALALEAGVGYQF
jgi:hypothetical protein